MTKKNILIVCQHFWPESFRVNDIADYLVEQNCSVEVLCGLPNYPSGRLAAGYGIFKNRRQDRNGIRIRRALEIPRGNNTNIRILLNYVSFPFFSLFHIPRLLTKKYDRILLYQLSPVMMSFAGIIVGKLKKIETTMYVLDLWPENLFSVLDIKNPLLRRLVTSVSHWHYRHVDKIVVLSERMKARIQEVTSIPENKIIVLPQACEKIYETDRHNPTLQKRFEGKFNVLYTGNISPAQSYETMISAARNLYEQGLKDINWIVVGDGMSKVDFERQVKEANLEDIFYFEGQKKVEEIPEYTSFADLLVGCLVKSELLEATIPAKVMSYVAAGRPIVLAMDGEVQELINEKIGCGLVGPAGDADKLTDNIRRIYAQTGKQRATLGKKARSYHFENFERNIILGRLYKFMFPQNTVD